MHTFLDEARIYVSAGDGGHGAMHFHREKFVPLGGPDGGDGGKGGSIHLRVNRELNTLFQFRHKRRFNAESGEPGGATRMHGRNGKDVTIEVPVGTIVRDNDTGELLADLTTDGQLLTVAQGGKGGLGNVHFKSSTNQAPAFAEKGEPGQERTLDLELKVIADVGIVGAPNAGKSTLLSVISSARPKIADYPFTTLTPNLGVVDTGDYSFVAADIPGLIEGAHTGVGLGHDFLRHIERTVVLLHMVDGSEDSPLETFQRTLEELRLYDPDLPKKPQLVVVNKMDVWDARERWPELSAAFDEMGYESFAIAAATGEGVDPLLYRLSDVVREGARLRKDVEVVQADTITIKPDPNSFTVERKRKTFYVIGETVERLAIMTDFESDEALYRLQRRLRQMGVVSALGRAGVQDGGKVRIGQVEFTWDPSWAPDLKTAASRARMRRGR